MRRSAPYIYFFLGLFSGLSVLLFRPFGSAWIDLFVGGALLAVAVAAVAYMIVEGSGPGERGPDF